MRAITSAATVAALMAGLLTGCNESGRGSSSRKKPSQLAACEKAFRKEYKRALEDQDDGKPPRKCRGIPKRELKRIAVRVIREETPRLPEPGDDR